MRGILTILTVGLGVIAGEAAAQQSDSPTPPPWAYPVNPGTGGGGGAGAQDDARHRLPDTDRSFTRAEIRNGFGPADWRPETHPPMPEIVARGREPDVRACGFCHYPNGQGRPENAPITGLPAAYIIQQMADFKSGARTSSEPRMGPPAAMVRLAQAANDEEVAAAAEYFASFPFRRWIRVVETSTVPRLRFGGGMWLPAEGSEPIGSRIVEVPEDTARTALRDPTSGFVAYVPVGSLTQGETLVRTGGGKTTACGVCHGDDLRGLGPVPPLAGRSPSYLMRQLFDFKHGTRAGAWAPLMKAVVAGLGQDHMLAIAAYAASLAP